jgi:integrase
MIYLGINCGYSNSDIAALPMKSLNLATGWIQFARVKTGIERRSPLWPETVQALEEWLKVRPQPKDPKHADLVFVTSTGGSWGKEIADNPLSKEMRKLLDKLGINGRRTFYHLRHTLQTIGDESGDFLAVRHIMGHASTDIADMYRERISDVRLCKVTEHVRNWLFHAPEGEGQEPDVIPMIG